MNWASDHRYHHVYSDREGDPYSVNRGFWWAHMGWMFYDYPSQDRPYKNAQDLKNDRLVMWQDRITRFRSSVSSFLFCRWRSARSSDVRLRVSIWGGFVRMVVVHQVTF